MVGSLELAPLLVFVSVRLTWSLYFSTGSSSVLRVGIASCPFFSGSFVVSRAGRSVILCAIIGTRVLVSLFSVFLRDPHAVLSVESAAFL